ncbi:response regulator transcription factor [Virgisporangium aurantiacum]|uniref:DNA-binding response regulator n=1 Tax=Virgisporangium aurantiacum TaxID=175570 RepID=A0A8J3ZIE4_9ACTN|nr:response regulator transcription factor [Virgisporangium aurantiacum]GIJ64454.1 DNA-binding response regulator [Virgisporangium aurantiacum]
MRVVIAEDSIILRDGLIRLLTAKGHHVVAETADATSLLPAVAEHTPDVAVVDVRMPPTHTDDGLRAAIDVRRHHPDVGILVFSQYVEVHYARRLFADDARGIGYLLKDRITEVAEFLTALERVAAGGSALDPEVVSRMLTAGRNEQGLARLTSRESEVLALMAEGLSNTAIAARMVVSSGAVEKFVTNIFTKLDLPPSDTSNRRVVAVLRYLESGPTPAEP